MAFCFYNPYSFFNYFDENKFISILTGFTFLVIFIFIYILRTYTFFERHGIPQAVRPFAPFGNIKDVVFEEITFYNYLRGYYNKFKRKGLKYGGLFLFFKPGLLVINPVFMQKISKEKNVYDVQTSNCHKCKIINLFSEKNIENFLLKYNAIKDSLITDLNKENMLTVLHNFVIQTTFTAFGFKGNPDLMSLVDSLLKQKNDAGFKCYFNLVYPFFQSFRPTQEMQDIIKDIVNHRKKNDIIEDDLMQSFIEIDNKGESNFDEIVLEIFNICVDDIIYSYNSLLFCLYELGSDKVIQEKLFDEIRRLSKENEYIDLKALQNFHFLDAVVKETLRKYPPTPTIIKRCKEDYKDEEFNMKLPKGSFVLYSVMGIHRDPTIFSEPVKFHPDRFLGNKEYDLYMPFGCDSRNEIGLKFTTLHIKLNIISIVSSYSISLSTKDHILEPDNKKLTLSPKEPLPIIFKSRSQ